MTEAPTPQKRNILLLAASGLRASLVEQLGRYPEFAIFPAASPEEASRRLAAAGCDILLVDATIGAAFARDASKDFHGPILVIGAARAPATPDLRAEYIARPFRFARLLTHLRAPPRAVERERAAVAIGAYRYLPGAFELTERDAATRHRAAIDDHRAGAAVAAVASIFRSGEVGRIA